LQEQNIKERETASCYSGVEVSSVKNEMVDSATDQQRVWRRYQSILLEAGLAECEDKRTLGTRMNVSLDVTHNAKLRVITRFLPAGLAYIFCSVRCVKVPEARYCDCHALTVPSSSAFTSKFNFESVPQALYRLRITCTSITSVSKYT